MKRTLLIINANSGSANVVEEDVVLSMLSAAGFDICARLKLPDDDLPTADEVRDGGFDVVAILSGDGTISSLCQKLVGWDGAILVLPGGTMNLLSRRLYGDNSLAGILARIELNSLELSAIPVIKYGAREILTGLTVGPSTRWGEVREGIRQGDMPALTEVLPVAWSETLADTGVWLEGSARQAYASVFIEPQSSNALSVMAFRANTIADMVGHGIAWLRRDFREGPRDDLGMMRNVTVVGDEVATGVLVDGEFENGELPLTCCADMSSLRFFKNT